uniref:Uncharacterized protein n=1 Tax=Beihai hermit crab virus 2 TaxID=1922389 RepID=A0A1L3KPB6_9VIRU|nr:hypothetical protein [Beihai hermit crab virus 2]
MSRGKITDKSNDENKSPGKYVQFTKDVVEKLVNKNKFVEGPQDYNLLPDHVYGVTFYYNKSLNVIHSIQELINMGAWKKGDGDKVNIKGKSASNPPAGSSNSPGPSSVRMPKGMSRDIVNKVLLPFNSTGAKTKAPITEYVDDIKKSNLIKSFLNWQDLETSMENQIKALSKSMNVEYNKVYATVMLTIPLATSKKINNHEIEVNVGTATGKFKLVKLNDKQYDDHNSLTLKRAKTIAAPRMRELCELGGIVLESPFLNHILTPTVARKVRKLVPFASSYIGPNNERAIGSQEDADEWVAVMMAGCTDQADNMRRNWIAKRNNGLGQTASPLDMDAFKNESIAIIALSWRTNTQEAESIKIDIMMDFV